MSLTGKLEHLQEINSPGIALFEILGRKKLDLPKICPDKMSRFELVEGKWGELGCTFVGYYVLEGSEVISKERVEAVDEKNMLISFNFFEGDLIKFYKTLKVTMQVTSEGEKNFVKSTYEYEKQNSDIPDPEQFKEFVSEIVKMIDAHCFSSAV